MSKVVKIRLGLYLVVLAAICAYPLYVIWQVEGGSIPARQFVFRCSAYDPYDPLRGRYVQLSFDQENILLDRALSRDSLAQPHLFAVLETDGEGYAKITDVVDSLSAVPTGSWALKIPANDIWGTFRRDLPGRGKEGDQAPEEPGNRFQYTLRLPFKRFFLNEKKAPAVEKFLGRVNGEGEAPVAALKVRILATGDFAVEDLLLDGMPFQEYLDKQR